MAAVSQHLTGRLEDNVVFIHEPPQGKDPSHSRVLGRNPAFHRWVFWSEPRAESSLTHSLLGSFPRFCPALSEKAIVLTPASKSGLNSEDSLRVSNMPQLPLISFWFHVSPEDRAACKKSNIYAEEFRSEAFREWNMYVGQWKGNCSSSQDLWISLVYPVIATNLSYMCACVFTH